MRLYERRAELHLSELPREEGMMNADKYSSLAALKEHVGESGYRIRAVNRFAPITIIAPHGGFIEPGTSAIARRVAGKNWNLFDFQGLQRQNGLDLHVTATNFRDPALSKLLRASAAAVSIHGMFAQGTKDIWLGGLNVELKALVERELVDAGFTVNANSPKYRGENPRNVVNTPPLHGVQLELSDELMAELFGSASRFLLSGRAPRSTSKFAAFVAALRRAIAEYVRDLRNSPEQVA
jgi:phage replication-related protein YjqB (UPF0714/DUF867 family)